MASPVFSWDSTPVVIDAINLNARKFLVKGFAQSDLAIKCVLRLIRWPKVKARCIRKVCETCPAVQPGTAAALGVHLRKKKKMIDDDDSALLL